MVFTEVPPEMMPALNVVRGFFGTSSLEILAIVAPKAWIALGAVAAVAAALLWPVFDLGTIEPARGARRWDSRSARLVLCYAAYGFGYIVPATFLPAMAREAMPDPALFGWAWPVFGAAAAGSTSHSALGLR